MAPPGADAMLEFKENRPDGRRKSPAALVALGVLVGVLLAAVAAVVIPRLLRGDGSPGHGGGGARGAPSFGPSDEWVLSRVARIDVPTIQNLSPLVEAAPNSLVLLRYLAAISNPRAAAAVAARIVELSPRFTHQPANFGGLVIWRGSRVVRPRGDDVAQPPAIRHHFVIPYDASRLFPGLLVDARYLGFAGDTLASGDFSPQSAGFTVVSYSDMRDSVEFFVECPLPEAVVAAAGGWALEIGVASDGSALPLNGADPETTRARMDFLE